MRRAALLTLLAVKVAVAQIAFAATPTAKYKLDETSGTTAVDSSGNGNHGTYVGTPTLNQAGAVSGSKAVVLNGTTQWVTVPEAVVGTFGEGYTVSVGMWFKAAADTHGVLLGQWASGSGGTPGDALYPASGYCPAIKLGTDGKIRVSVFWHGDSTSPITTSGTYDDGEWHHVAVTCGGGVEKLYMDGVYVGSRGSTEHSFQGTNFALGVGFGGAEGHGWPDPVGWDWFGGSIDNAYFYSDVLTAGEVEALYEETEEEEPADLEITTASLPNGVQGSSYSQSVAVTGGVPPYTWSASSGFGAEMPSGLSLNTATGAITGTISSGPGSYNFSVGVVDSQGSPDSDVAYYSITVVGPVIVTTTSLPGVAQGASYSQSLSGTGGIGSYTWSLVSGSLPTGLSLSSGGSITGTASGSPGTASFTVEAEDTQGNTDTQALSIVVSPPELTITTTSLPGVVQGASYSQSLSATGGESPYTWSVVSGSLPTGLSLSSGGSITGTASGSPGTASFTVQAVDSAGSPDSDTQALSIVVSPPDLVITTTSLPGVVQGASYSQSLSATGGVSPYTWSVATGSLPTGLSLSSGGSITGTASGSAGTVSFTVQAQDSAGSPDTDTQALSIVVSAAGTVVITTTSLPEGTQNKPYVAGVSTSGGSGDTFTWGATGLPTGLHLVETGESCVIEGVPTQWGSFGVTITLSTVSHGDAEETFTLVIEEWDFPEGEGQGLQPAAGSAIQNWKDIGQTPGPHWYVSTNEPGGTAKFEGHESNILPPADLSNTVRVGGDQVFSVLAEVPKVNGCGFVKFRFLVMFSGQGGYYLCGCTIWLGRNGYVQYWWDKANAGFAGTPYVLVGATPSGPFHYGNGVFVPPEKPPIVGMVNSIITNSAGVRFAPFAGAGSTLIAGRVDAMVGAAEQGAIMAALVKLRDSATEMQDCTTIIPRCAAQDFGLGAGQGGGGEGGLPTVTAPSISHPGNADTDGDGTYDWLDPEPENPDVELAPSASSIWALITSKLPSWDWTGADPQEMTDDTYPTFTLQWQHVSAGGLTNWFTTEVSLDPMTSDNATGAGTPLNDLRVLCRGLGVCMVLLFAGLTVGRTLLGV